MLARSLRRYLALAGPERVLLTRAFVSLGVIDVALRIFGFRRIVERAQPLPSPVDRVIRLGDLQRADH